MLPNVRSISLPARDCWTAGPMTVLLRHGQLLPLAAGTELFRAPALTHLHVTNKQQVRGWRGLWRLIHAADHLQTLFLERLDTAYKMRPPQNLLWKTDLSHLVDLDLVRSSLPLWEFRHMMQACTHLV